MGPRAGLDGRKISSPPGFDPGPFSPGIPTELPGPRINIYTMTKLDVSNRSEKKKIVSIVQKGILRYL